MATYDSFLLQVWRNVGQSGPQWVGRLEHLQRGEIVQVTSIEGLVEHLEAVTGSLEPHRDVPFVTPMDAATPASSDNR